MTASRSFLSLFGQEPTVASTAPGRVNLMGDHTDYNAGLVLPATIPQRTDVEAAAGAADRVRLWSDQADEGVIEYRLGGEVRDGTWADYVRGMTQVLAGHGLRAGFDARIISTVPLGSGLSSSASLEIAIGRALRELFALEVDDVGLAHAGRRAENEFVGAPVGIMDQMACSLGEPSSALFLDTRSLEFERVPLPAAAALIVIHSGVSHRHSEGGYKTRRAECEQAAAACGVATLRELDGLDDPRLAALVAPLDRRVRHVITENARVRATVAAMRAGDLPEAGRLFGESHASLRDDYEVSVAEVDALVDIAGAVEGVYGARITGGGFGGSIVALADADRAGEGARQIIERYRHATGTELRIMLPA